jgi:hypothetical protein
MSWTTGELWLDTDLAVPERRVAPAFAAVAPLPFPVPPGLAASRRRREAGGNAEPRDAPARRRSRCHLP